MQFTIWKVRRLAGERPDFFSYSLKRNGHFSLVLTADQLGMLFPNLKKSELIPEVPGTAIVEINGELL